MALYFATSSKSVVPQSYQKCKELNINNIGLRIRDGKKRDLHLNTDPGY